MAKGSWQNYGRRPVPERPYVRFADRRIALGGAIENRAEAEEIVAVIMALVPLLEAKTEEQT